MHEKIKNINKRKNLETIFLKIFSHKIFYFAGFSHEIHKLDGSVVSFGGTIYQTFAGFANGIWKCLFLF